MRRVSAFALGLTLSGCATRAGICRQDPRFQAVDDRRHGIPDTSSEQSTELLRDVRTQSRHCQSLVEGYLWLPHVVWFTGRHSDDVTVVVRFPRDDGYSEERAELPWSIARILDRSCERFLKNPPACERGGVDGVFFHIAHHAPGHGYLMRTFWSPARDGIEARFATLVGALRDYVLVPPNMRSVKLHDLPESANGLEQALDRGRPDPEKTLLRQID